MLALICTAIVVDTSVNICGVLPSCLPTINGIWSDCHGHTCDYPETYVVVGDVGILTAQTDKGIRDRPSAAVQGDRSTPCSIPTGALVRHRSGRATPTPQTLPATQHGP